MKKVLNRKLQVIKLLAEWYVLHVRTGEETNVRDYIKREIPQIKALAPRREMKERKDGIWRTRIRTLFPGYVFINSLMTVDEYYKLSNIGGVINILKGASSSPSPIPEEEMEIILRLSRDNDLVGITDLVIDGDNIKVVTGPLEGYEGQILKVDRHRLRARVKFTLLGQEKCVDLGINVIEKIG
ncbi:MAG: antiterminator LoaP [Bacillota bacterium]|nr:antiterminator LoaP [Bacillota bacterium]